MKIQTLTLLIVAGSMVASGYLIGPAPGATVATGSTVATTAAPASAVAPTPLAPPPQPTTKVRTMRPPVPLQVSTHDQYFTSPSADAVATDTQTAAATMGTTGINSTGAVDAKPLDDQAQAQANIVAKAAIEQDGYRDVRALAMGADGTWHGRAMRGSTEITVSVDANGSVSAD